MLTVVYDGQAADGAVGNGDAAAGAEVMVMPLVEQ